MTTTTKTTKPAYRFGKDDGDPVVMKGHLIIAWQDRDSCVWDLILPDSDLSATIACPTGKELTPDQIGALHEAVVALRGRS